VNVELLADAERPAGWWLMVGGSEQSFVDLDDPSHLEFEYVQMMSYVVETAFPDDLPLAALHLGGGLCTVPRWVADRYPGSKQTVAEVSDEIAAITRSLGSIARVKLVVDDALRVLDRTRAGSIDLLVCDVYNGPETETSVYPHDALASARAALRDDGLYVCNVSDAAPFGFARTVAATLRGLFAEVVVLVEPAVLRGRRSGNLVLAAADRGFDLAMLRRRAASGPLRASVLAGGDLAGFVGDATVAYSQAELPRSGESPVDPIRLPGATSRATAARSRSSSGTTAPRARGSRA
jgi:hypothetical protein